MRIDDTEHSGNVLIPVSTLDLFFQHFNTLQKRLDDIEALMSRDFNASRFHSPESLVDSGLDENSRPRVLTLKDLLDKHNSQLEELRIDRQLLLDENKLLKKQLEKLDKLTTDLTVVREKVEGAPRDQSQFSQFSDACGTSRLSCHRPSSLNGPPTLDGERAERREVILHGVLRDAEIPASALIDISFATLSTVCPSLQRDEIEGVRILPTRRSTGGRGDSNTPNGVKSGATHPPSCVVTLADSRRVRQVMKGKRSTRGNYLTTSDIKPSLLSPESTAHVPDRKILINEMLPREQFELFRSLKPVAQSLGFKYVWHAGGRFLARRRGGEQAHIFTSAADLHAVSTAFGTERVSTDGLSPKPVSSEDSTRGSRRRRNITEPSAPMAQSK